MRTQNPHSFLCGASFAAILSSLIPAARADYATEVLSENPLVFYRFDDGIATDDMPPPADNLGSLGAAGDGIYTGVFELKAPGAIAGNDSVAFSQPDAAAIGLTGSVNVPYHAAFNPPHTGPNAFTVECWVKPNTATSTLLSPVSSMSFVNGRAGYLIYQNAGVWQLRIGNKASTVAAILDGGTVTPGQWQHLAATYSGGASGTMTLYVNGQPVGSMAASYEANDDAPFVIGATAAPNRTFDGGVDEVAFHPAALPAARILARFNMRTDNPAGYQAHVLADNPAGYWRLDEDWAPRIPPAAANAGSLPGADGSYHGGAKNTSAGPSPASGFLGFGENNSCLSLENANGYVGTALGLLNNRPAFTVMGWVKRGAVHSTRGGYFGQNDLLEFGDAGEGTLIEAWSSASGQLITSPPYPFEDGEWGFIAYTADGTSVRLFINGEQVGIVNQAVSNYGQSAFNFNIGGGGIFNATGDYFRGEIDEVAVFGHAVTPGRVKQMYDAARGAAPPELSDMIPVVTPSVDVIEGQPYSLFVDPTGSPPFTYQWQLNGANIPGATSQTYSVAAAEVNSPPSAFRRYRVIITNDFGELTSNETEVYVAPLMKWTAGASSEWRIGGPLNWETSGGTAVAYDHDVAVLFDDSAEGTAVELTEHVFPVGVIFENETKDYTFSGADFDIQTLFADGSLIKNGGGSVELGVGLLAVDRIVVNDGTLKIGDGTSGELTAQVASAQVNGGNLAINQAAGTSYATATTVASGATLSFTGAGALALEGANTIGGSGDEIFDRNGTVLVNRPNTVSGSVTIASGTVIFDGSQNGDRLAVNQLVTVNPGATMEVHGVNSLPTHANSVDVTLQQAALNVISGGSFVIGEEGTSHAHLRNLNLNGGTVTLGYSGGGGVYDGESFQHNGDIVVTGSSPSSIVMGDGANTGNSGIAFRAWAGVEATPEPLVHTFNVADVTANAAPDLIVAVELENRDGNAANAALCTVAKTGPGTLRLADGIAHSYTGTLRVDGGTLEGTGSIAGPLVVSSGGTISPGVAAGTFTAGPTTINGTYRCEIDGAAADRLVVNGALNLSGATLVVDVLGGGTGQSAYIIASYTSLTGTFASVSLPPGYELNYFYNSGASANTIALVSTGGASPYETWIAGFPSIPPDERGANDDPDKDGYSNAMEFALGGSPANGGDRPRIHHLTADTDADSQKELLMTIAVFQGTPAFTAGPSPTATAQGYTYTIQGSTTLDAFSSAVSPVSPAVATGLPAAPAGYEWRTFRLDGSNGLPSRGFLRVRITP